MDSSAHPASDEQSSAVRSQNPIRVLVADGSADFQWVASLLLEAADSIEIVGRVEDGQEVIEAATVLQPDLVLMDVELPSIDGISAASILCERFPMLTIALLSSRNSPRLRANCGGSGAKYFIHRPTLSKELPEILSQLQELRLKSPE